jgi:hypothetical protein
MREAVMFDRLGPVVDVGRQVDAARTTTPRVVRKTTPRLQAKLAVGAVDDPFEREADRLAESVMALLANGARSPVRRSTGTTTRIRRSSAPMPVVGADGGSVDGAIEGRIRRSTGRPLDRTTSQQMTSAFGTDMSRVRIHTGAHAAELNRSLDARAFTLGSDIFFGKGEFSPRTSGGQQLLAHEIAHTLQQSSDARRAPIVRRYVKLTKDPNVSPDTQIKTTPVLKEAMNKSGFTLDPSKDADIVPVLVRWLKSKQELEFDNVKQMLDGARAQAAERQRSKADIDPFAMKAEESSADDTYEERSASESSHYDFRNNPKAQLPDIGADPTQPKEKPRKGIVEQPGYYYHVTSYSNLKRIFAEGLNPAAGGGVGGSSYQNADAAMNVASANDSRNKVFVATVGKLTQRYLSLRLRQNDLFGRHGACIVEVLADKAGLGEKGAESLFAQICLGEEAVVLRFENTWASGDWENDPIDKAAFALRGRAVPPANIQSLSIGGWVPLTDLTEIANVIGTEARFTEFRSALLAFYGDHNETLEKLPEPAGWGVIPDLLLAVLKEKKLTVG